MPGVTIVPSGLFDGQHDWKPNYEQWRNSRMCFVEDVKAVREGSLYPTSPDLREFKRIWAKL
jgi:hypothetical protein